MPASKGEHLVQRARRDAVRSFLVLTAVLVAASFARPAMANPCEYRPTLLVGQLATGVLMGGAAAILTVGFSARAVARASALSISRIGMAFVSPFVIVPAAAFVIVIVAFEGACHLGTPEAGPRGKAPPVHAAPRDPDEGLHQAGDD